VKKLYLINKHNMNLVRRMPEVSPKTVALTVVPIAGVGVGVTFYIMKLKQRILTLTADKAQAKVCTDWVTFTGTVTDGFGKPVANETITVYADGEQIGTVNSDMNGNFGFRLFWHTNNKHLDHDGSGTVNITACVGKYCSPPVSVLVTWTACTQCPRPA
jgi:hypothetical protein